MSAIDLVAIGVLLLLLIPIVHSDLQERRIPNWLNALLALGGIALSALTAPDLRTVLMGFIAPLATIVVFLGLIALMKLLRRPGTLGLGDVKFLAAASLWVGFIGSAMVFVVASLLSLGFVLVRAPWRPVDLRSMIPFAPFLAASLLLVYGVTAVLAPSGVNSHAPTAVAAAD